MKTLDAQQRQNIFGAVGNSAPSGAGDVKVKKQNQKKIQFLLHTFSHNTYLFAFNLINQTPKLSYELGNVSGNNECIKCE